MKILALGDVSGSCGVVAVEKVLRKLKLEKNADFVIVNGENSSERGGMERSSVKRLFEAGADVVTGGNHSLRNKDIYSMLEENPMLLRPLNYGDSCRGAGYVIAHTSYGRVLIMNVIGQIFMDPADSPFTAVDRLLNGLKDRYDFAIADFHGEATSEKAAFARHYDGRIHIVFGTHTHVQTSDARIFKDGTGFITDIGMCGADDSILGVRSEAVIGRMVSRTPERFLNADGDARVDGAVFTLDPSTKRVVNAESFSVYTDR